MLPGWCGRGIFEEMAVKDVCWWETQLRLSFVEREGEYWGGCK